MQLYWIFCFTVIVMIISKRRQETYCANDLPKFRRAFFFLFCYQFRDKGILLLRDIACAAQRERYAYIDR